MGILVGRPLVGIALVIASLLVGVIMVVAEGKGAYHIFNLVKLRDGLLLRFVIHPIELSNALGKGAFDIANELKSDLFAACEKQKKYGEPAINLYQSPSIVSKEMHHWRSGLGQSGGRR